jgi:hypothetical protein
LKVYVVMYCGRTLVFADEPAAREEVRKRNRPFGPGGVAIIATDLIGHVTGTDSRQMPPNK